MSLVLLVIVLWFCGSALLLIAAWGLHEVSGRREAARGAARAGAPGPPGGGLDLVVPGTPNRRGPEAPRKVETRPLRRVVH